jgi:hypothetical protein
MYIRVTYRESFALTTPLNRVMRFFSKKIWPCGLSYLFFADFLTNRFLINFIQTILLYSHVILNILRHLASNRQNNLAVHGHSLIQAIKTPKNYYNIVRFYAWLIGIFLLRAIWRYGQSDMFFSNIKILHQCRLYGAADNPQEITLTIFIEHPSQEPRTLMLQGYNESRLKSSFRKFYGRYNYRVFD